MGKHTFHTHTHTQPFDAYLCQAVANKHGNNQLIYYCCLNLRAKMSTLFARFFFPFSRFCGAVLEGVVLKGDVEEYSTRGWREMIGETAKIIDSRISSR